MLMFEDGDRLLRLFHKPETEGGLFLFFSTLPAQAEGVSSKNKTYVPPGLWEKGPPAYCFGIWGRIWSKDTAECIQTGRERESIRGAGLLYFEDRS